MRRLLLVALVFSSLLACTRDPFVSYERPVPIRPGEPLELMATSEQRWTGVAVTLNQRVFVSYPRWIDDTPLSVAEVMDGAVNPYPDEEWNQWDGTEQAVADHWVAVQSVATDRETRLWVLDSGNPRFEGVIPGAAKLVGIEPATGEVFQRIAFEAPIVQPDSYLNDVRIDNEGGRAYITDSGNGALIVVDLDTEQQWRILDEHPSTHSDGTPVVIHGERWEGGARDVHADGLALHQGKWLYYKALTGKTLYRLPLDVLRADPPDERAVEAAVESLVDIGPTDGLVADSIGIVYFTDLDDSAIRWYFPRYDALGTVLEDEKLAWPDSIACEDDALFITTSRIHEGSVPAEPYALYRLQLSVNCP